MRGKHHQSRGPLGRQFVLLALMLCVTARADLPFDTTQPLSCFTNLANRFLQSELNLSTDCIQVYPTNQYTPAAHRLLQLAANLAASVTNAYTVIEPETGRVIALPPVFRPMFAKQGDTVFIVGYQEMHAVENSDLTLPKDLSDPDHRATLSSDDHVYGIPILFGARKGLPNFNEYSMDLLARVARKLEMRRPTLSSFPNETNQMYVLSLQAAIGLEAWNSYSNAFNVPVELHVYNNATMALYDGDMLLTNAPVPLIPPQVPSMIVSNWPGYPGGAAQQSPSFVVPLLTNAMVIPDSVFRHATRTLVPATSIPPFERIFAFPLPDFILAVTNRLRFFIREPSTKRLLDYVHLGDLGTRLNISKELDPTADIPFGIDGVWETNRAGGSTSITAPTLGIVNQLNVSLGNPVVSDSDWYNAGTTSGGGSKVAAIEQFRRFVFGHPSNTNLIQQVPFIPTRQLLLRLIWQANDPLVHYARTDLQLTQTNLLNRPHLGTAIPYLENLSNLNVRFKPWGGRPGSSADPNAFNLYLKDPLVRRSDDWNFPENEPLSLSSLRRIHRGTPWQSVYLKSAPVSISTWALWTGVSNVLDAERMQPVNDWQLVSRMAGWLNTNSPHALVSVNQLASPAGQAAFDGLQVLTNSTPDANLGQLNPVLEFESITVESNSPQAMQVAQAIDNLRLTRPGGYFTDLNEILAARELTVDSPWLNRSTVQRERGISDEAYEILPVQLLSRLRTDLLGSLSVSEGEAELHFTAWDGYTYDVQSSSNLVDWVTIGSQTATNGGFDFNLPTGNADHPEFFRAVLPPQ